MELTIDARATTRTSGGIELPIGLLRLLADVQRLDDVYEFFDVAALAEQLRAAGRCPQHNYGMRWAYWSRIVLGRERAGLPVVSLEISHLVAIEALGYTFNVSTGEARYGKE